MWAVLHFSQNLIRYKLTLTFCYSIIRVFNQIYLNGFRQRSSPSKSRRYEFYFIYIKNKNIFLNSSCKLILRYAHSKYCACHYFSTKYFFLNRRTWSQCKPNEVYNQFNGHIFYMTYELYIVKPCRNALYNSNPL